MNPAQQGARVEGNLARAIRAGFVLVLPLFSMFFIWQSTLVTEPPRTVAVGPRTFPIAIGLAMLGVSVLLSWRTIRERRIWLGRVSLPSFGSEADGTAISDWPATWLVLGAFLLMILFLEQLGFILVMGTFLFGLATFFAPRKWLRNLLTAVAFSVFFYYLFAQLLGSELPKGLLGPLLG